MRFLLLLPLLAYIGLAFFNLDILTATNVVNVYNLVELRVPSILYISIFFILYLILLFLYFDGVNAFAQRKLNRLENEVFELKSKLYDEREDELVVFMKEQKNKIENFLKMQEAHFEKLQTENENLLLKNQAETNRIMDKLHLVDKSVLEKIKESFKPKN